MAKKKKKIVLRCHANERVFFSGETCIVKELGNCDLIGCTKKNNVPLSHINLGLDPEKGEL